MTVQTCCGGISSDDPNMNKGRMPYMIRNCYSDPEWSLSSCQENCCDKNRYDGGSKGQCVATQDGGYCKYRDRYWRYDGGSQILFPATDTRSLEKYPSDFRDVQEIEDLIRDLRTVPNHLNDLVVAHDKLSEDLAHRFADTQDVIFLGRGIRFK